MNSHNNLIMLECIGWKYYKRSDYTLWFKGYVTNYKMSELHMELKCIVSNYSKINIDVLKEWIKGVKGHFAIVIDFDGCVFATTDKISSIPLYYVEREGEAIIGNHAPSLKRYANIDSKEKNSDAILEIFSPSDKLEYQIAEGSVSVPTDAKGIISVGAFRR